MCRHWPAVQGPFWVGLGDPMRGKRSHLEEGPVEAALVLVQHVLGRELRQPPHPLVGLQLGAEGQAADLEGHHRSEIVGVSG